MLSAHPTTHPRLKRAACVSERQTEGKMEIGKEKEVRVCVCVCWYGCS